MTTPRTLARRPRAVTQPSSSSIVFFRLLRRLEAATAALATAADLDDERLHAVGLDVAAVRDELADLGQAATTLDDALAAERDARAAGDDAVTEAATGAAQDAMARANAAMRVANTGRDGAAEARQRLDAVDTAMAGMPADVEHRIEAATTYALEQAQAQAAQEHGAIRHDLDGVGARVTAEEQARAALAAALVARLSVLDATLAALTTRIAAVETAQTTLTARVDALAARRAHQATGAALLPALTVGTPKDVDVPWDGAPLAAVPHSVWVAGVDGVLTLPAWAVKTWTAGKAVVTVTSPALVAVNVARIRVGCLYEKGAA